MCDTRIYTISIYIYIYVHMCVYIETHTYIYIYICLALALALALSLSLSLSLSPRLFAGYGAAQAEEDCVGLTFTHKHDYVGFALGEIR